MFRSKKVFSMFFLSLLFCAGLFVMSGVKTNAEVLNKSTDDTPILDSDGNPVTNDHSYYVKVVIPDTPQYSYYFENHYKGAYDWVFISSTDKENDYTYTIDATHPVEGDHYYFKDVTDDGYLKTYKPDWGYTKGGVYEGNKSGADTWSFERSYKVPGIYAYSMSSIRDLSVLADTGNTSSLVVNSHGDSFLVVFEKA